MNLKTILYGKTYKFNSVQEVMCKASELKSGDVLANVSAADTKERIAAKVVLSDLTVKDIRENPAVDYDKDEVTRVIQDDLNINIYNEIKGYTIGELRELILDNNTTYEILLRLSKGMTSEVIAAVSKIMGNLDLIYASKKFKITSHCNTTLGRNNTFSSRLQPNHPTDDVKGVTASLLEGLSYGVGDALIGLNPAIDTVDSVTRILNLFEEVKEKYKIPTQNCVLSHVTTQIEAIKKGAPVDLCFQSIAGSQIACEAFGINVKMLEEANELMKTYGTSTGPNYMYFETGQGSELSSSGHNNWDQQTMESRCYGLARHFNPYLVNTVVGFIGPEYIYDSKQLIRAGLEDNFCGHMHGLPMGCDVCYTNHMQADQNDVENLAVLLANAGCHYIMGLPHGDDVMLMYQSTGYQDVAALRELLRLEPSPEFKSWLEKWGIWQDGKLGPNAGDPTIFL